MFQVLPWFLHGLFRSIAPEGNANIENQFQITVLFPDSSLPETTNGGFDTQEDFRNYIMDMRNQKHRQKDRNHPPDFSIFLNVQLICQLVLAYPR